MSGDETSKPHHPRIDMKTKTTPHMPRIIILGILLTIAVALTGIVMAAVEEEITISGPTKLECTDSLCTVTNADTGEILETMTPTEMEIRASESKNDFRIEGPDASGRYTFYDKKTGEFTGYGYKG